MCHLHDMSRSFMEQRNKREQCLTITKFVIWLCRNLVYSDIYIQAAGP